MRDKLDAGGSTIMGNDISGLLQNATLLFCAPHVQMDTDAHAVPAVLSETLIPSTPALQTQASMPPTRESWLDGTAKVLQTSMGPVGCKCLHLILKVS